MISFTFLKTTLAATENGEFLHGNQPGSCHSVKMKRWRWLGVWWWVGDGRRMIPWHSTPSPKLSSAPSGLPLYCFKTSLGPPYAYLAEDLQDKEENILEVGSV